MRITLSFQRNLSKHRDPMAWTALSEQTDVYLCIGRVALTKGKQNHTRGSVYGSSSHKIAEQMRGSHANKDRSVDNYLSV